MTEKNNHLAQVHQQLQALYERYPLARLLVESAGQIQQTQGYNEASCHSAYKDWLWAVFGQENPAFYDVLSVIDALLPENHPEKSIVTYNPALPGLPARPEPVQSSLQVYSMRELPALMRQEKHRHERMRQLLEAFTESKVNTSFLHIIGS